MRQEFEVQEELNELIEKEKQIKENLKEMGDKIPLTEAFAGSIKGTILNIQIKTLAWVMGIENEQYKEYVKNKENKLIELLRTSFNFLN